MKPALRSGLFSASSYSTRARARPRRIAPAWPLMPPPSTVTRMSNLSPILVSSSGWRTTMRAVSRLKKLSSGLPLTTMLPLPGRRNTRAAEDLRRPVPYCCCVAMIIFPKLSLKVRAALRGFLRMDAHQLSDVQRLRLLGRVRVLGAAIDLQLAVHGAAERILRQHA